jgi:hypothetical protein
MTAIAAAVGGSGQEYDHSKIMLQERRRYLLEYIKQLQLPYVQASSYYYEQTVQSIANAHDPRGIPTMIEVMADTSPRLTGRAQLVAAAFLGEIRDKRAIPILKTNLTMERRFGPPGESAKYTPYWNRAVHVGAAAALFQLGELQAALPVFRSVLAMGDSDPRGIPSNAFQVVGTPIDAYVGRPGALDTIYQFFREATVSGNPELRAGAALRLVGVDSELAFSVATEVLGLAQSGSKEDTHKWYQISTARRGAVRVLGAIGDARAKQSLKALLTDSDESVREAADYALSELSRRGK